MQGTAVAFRPNRRGTGLAGQTRARACALATASPPSLAPPHPTRGRYPHPDGRSPAAPATAGGHAVASWAEAVLARRVRGQGLRVSPLPLLSHNPASLSSKLLNRRFWNRQLPGHLPGPGLPRPTPAPLWGRAIRHWRVPAAPWAPATNATSLPTPWFCQRLAQCLPLPPGLVSVATLLQTGSREQTEAPSLVPTPALKPDKVFNSG